MQSENGIKSLMGKTKYKFGHFGFYTKFFCVFCIGTMWLKQTWNQMAGGIPLKGNRHSLVNMWLTQDTINRGWALTQHWWWGDFFFFNLLSPEDPHFDSLQPTFDNLSLNGPLFRHLVQIFIFSPIFYWKCGQIGIFAQKIC